jgi:hypothetical protein
MTLMQQGWLVQQSTCEMPVPRSPMERQQAEKPWGQQ